MNKTDLPATAKLIASALPVQLADQFVYSGMCDASAAASLGHSLFVVANDESNRLKVYRRGVRDPVHIVDLSKFLGTPPAEESDLEGAATIEDRIYWISSHARNKNGKVRESRCRFFATEATGDSLHLRAVGRPYRRLLDDMIAAPQLARYDLARAASRTPEAEGAFNIEGLAATRDGALLIGLRNPAPRGMALVVPLLNPAAVVDGRESACFGDALELDLGGLAIRSMELVGMAIMLVGGPSGDRGPFALFQWSGDSAHKPVRLHDDFGAVRPEALFAIPGTRHVQILSDDGGSHVKKLSEAEQTFRSVTLAL